MKASVTIRTDSLTICDGSVKEGGSTLEIVLAALHHEASAYRHLKDLPWANLSIQVRPVMDVQEVSQRIAAGEYPGKEAA